MTNPTTSLLVVIAIIGMLACLLMPSLQQARRTARSIQCVNNERQIYIAVSLYANNNANFMPGPTNSPLLLHRVDEYVDSNLDINVFGKPTFMSKPGGIWFCPDRHNAEESPYWSGGNAAANWYTNYQVTGGYSNEPHETVTGGWNYRCTSPSTNWYNPHRITQITPQSPILGEIHFKAPLTYGGVSFNYTNIPVICTFSFGSDTNWNGVAFSHDNFSNFLIIDGSVRRTAFWGVNIFSSAKNLTFIK